MFCVTTKLLYVTLGFRGMPRNLCLVFVVTFSPTTIRNKIINAVAISIVGTIHFNITHNYFSGRTNLNSTTVSTTTSAASSPTQRKCISVAKAFVSAVVIYAVAKLAVTSSNILKAINPSKGPLANITLAVTTFSARLNATKG